MANEQPAPSSAPAASGLNFRCQLGNGGVPLKVFDDGRRCRCIAGEWALWLALRAAQAETTDLRRQLAEVDVRLKAVADRGDVLLAQNEPHLAEGKKGKR